MPPVTLIVDTSIHGAAVGLVSAENTGAELVFSDIASEIMDSARQLPLLVERGLSQIEAQFCDIRGIIISQGPGSFTGIRVGLSYAFGLSRGLNDSTGSVIPIAGVSSLVVLAESWAMNSKADVAVFLPSTKKSGYVAVVVDGKSKLLAIDVAKISPQSFGVKSWYLIGEWQELESFAREGCADIVQSLAPSQAAQMAVRFVSDRLCRGIDFSWSHLMPEALYLRKSTVEEKAQEVSR